MVVPKPLVLNVPPGELSVMFRVDAKLKVELNFSVPPPKVRGAFALPSLLSLLMVIVPAHSHSQATTHTEAIPQSTMAHSHSDTKTHSEPEVT